ncbi:MAG: lipoate--protein ligase family protein [Oscillatoriales cyanobacterium C42_A2020_001]|nr:lipoate--protein ligase family protein [Leptolyngbyaceae cyanobacterium C42_A2020_001]
MKATNPSRKNLEPKPNWRFVPPICASGQVQMALDCWLFKQHLQGLHPPTLRFYTWQPIAISLGYHQRQYPDSWNHLTWNGQPVDLVRRPTGGRAVLHQGDLTYAVVTSELSGNRMEAYQQICEFLIHGWRSLGVELLYGHAGRGYIGNPNCFGSATSADLVLADGSKLIGSAQYRRGNTVLQHGSMRLHQSADLFQTVFGERDTQMPQLPLSFQNETMYETLISALVAAAMDCFGAAFEVKPLSHQEWQMVCETYTHS